MATRFRGEKNGGTTVQVIAAAWQDCSVHTFIEY